MKARNNLINFQKFQISEDDETKDCRGEERPAHDGQGQEGDGEDEGPGGEVALLLSQPRSQRHSRSRKVIFSFLTRLELLELLKKY